MRQDSRNIKFNFGWHILVEKELSHLNSRACEILFQICWLEETKVVITESYQHIKYTIMEDQIFQDNDIIIYALATRTVARL